MPSSFPWGKVSRYLPAILCIITLNFFLVHSMPGDPLIHLLGEDNYGRIRARNPQQLEELRAKYGLDDSTLAQYVGYLRNLAVVDLGWSYQYNRPVLDVILYRLKWTLLLSVARPLRLRSRGGPAGGSFGHAWRNPVRPGVDSGSYGRLLHTRVLPGIPVSSFFRFFTPTWRLFGE